MAEAKGNGAKFLPTTWPVGQVVKTAASHAVNIGSNPVRVTTSKQAADHSLPHECESTIPPLLFLSDFKRFAGLKIEDRALDKAERKVYSMYVLR